MKRLIYVSLSLIAFLLLSFNSNAQPGDYEIINDTDCDIEVRLTLYNHTGAGCASNSTIITDTGWLTITANSTHWVYGSGWPTGWWNRAELKNPDYPDECSDPPDVIEEAGPQAGRGQDGASCDCTDIKISTDQCYEATIEVG